MRVASSAWIFFIGLDFWTEPAARATRAKRANDLMKDILCKRDSFQTGTAIPSYFLGYFIGIFATRPIACLISIVCRMQISTCQILTCINNESMWQCLLFITLIDRAAIDSVESIRFQTNRYIVAVSTYPDCRVALETRTTFAPCPIVWTNKQYCYTIAKQRIFNLVFLGLLYKIRNVFVIFGID